MLSTSPNGNEKQFSINKTSDFSITNWNVYTLPSCSASTLKIHLFFHLIQIPNMQTLNNPIVICMVVVFFFLPYANVNLPVLLWCLCGPASFRGVNPLTFPLLPNTVNTSGFCLWNNGCLMLMLSKEDYIIIPSILILTDTHTHTHMLTHACLFPSPAWLLLR